MKGLPLLRVGGTIKLDRSLTQLDPQTLAHELNMFLIGRTVSKVSGITESVVLDRGYPLLPFSPDPFAIFDPIKISIRDIGENIHLQYELGLRPLYFSFIIVIICVLLSLIHYYPVFEAFGIISAMYLVLIVICASSVFYRYRKARKLFFEFVQTHLIARRLA
jgi:hypothetical protein